jgi:S1-C subfamily serine protease
MMPAGALARSFFAGVMGGVAVVAVAAVAFVLAGGLGSSTKTVTVERTRILSTGAYSQRSGASARQVYEADAPGVVFVSASGESQPQSSIEYLKGEGGNGQGTATGSGFEVDGRGTILTNWHVIEGASRVTVGLESGKSVEASVIGKDPSHDIAVLRIPTVSLTMHPLPLGDSSTVHVGDPALAVGNPFGLASTLTTGVISALERQITSPNGLIIKNAIQTDAPINPGNSGGPLLDGQGRVIGINSQIETSGSGGGSVGVAFAIPINTATNELSRLWR